MRRPNFGSGDPRTRYPLFQRLNEAWLAGRDAGFRSPDGPHEPPAHYDEHQRQEFLEGVQQGLDDLRWLASFTPQEHP